MAKDSRIEWTHHTFNPWWGCVKVSPACTNCYAETWSHRLGMDLWGRFAERRVPSQEYWHQPLRWNKEALRCGERRRVFCASMADVFEARAELNEWREQLWPLIEQTQQLDWLLLTKRPQNVDRMTPWDGPWPANVWLGTTAENQKYADARVPVLLGSPARIHFISAEPLLGPLSLKRWPGVDWVIAGGESGRGTPPIPSGSVGCAMNAKPGTSRSTSSSGAIGRPQCLRALPRVSKSNSSTKRRPLRFFTALVSRLPGGFLTVGRGMNFQGGDVSKRQSHSRR